MSTVYKVASTAFAVINAKQVTSNIHTGTTVDIGHTPDETYSSDAEILFKFAPGTTPLSFRKFESIRCLFYANTNPYSSGGETSSGAGARIVKGDWESSSVTYEFKPEDSDGLLISCPKEIGPTASWIELSSSEVKDLAAFLGGTGIRLWVYGSVKIYTPESSYAPYVEYSVSNENVSLSFKRFSPADGAKINRFNKCSISFELEQTGIALETLGIVSYTIQWTGGEEITVPVSGLPLSASYSIPANTLPGGDVVITVTVTDNAGGTTTKSVTVNTEDSVSSARTVSPVDTYVDGSAPVTFKWKHVNSSGSKQTKAILQVWPEGDSVVTEAEINGAVYEYTVPANTFTSGDYNWRVATFNADGVQGSWATAKFLVIAAPTQPIVLVEDDSPRPSVLWQTNEQEAYQIQLSGIYDQILFGNEQTWRCPVYLKDGTYTIRVRAQNKYGLWSDWGEAPIVVSNNPSREISLSVQFGHTAKLSWDRGEYDHYLIYRDDVPIARTEDTEYVDLYSCGQVSYFVRGCYADRYDYGLSDTITGRISIQTTMIKPINGDFWILLPTSTQLHNSVKKKVTRDVQRLLVQGRPYPTSEVGEHSNKEISINCAFARQHDPMLEQLLGQLVCLKTDSQDMAIGTLSELQVSSDYFLVSYALTVSQEYFQEEIDIDTGYILPG